MKVKSPEPILGWYNKNVTIPLAGVLVVVLSVMTLLVGRTWLQQRAFDSATLNKAATLVSMAITQKNRTLLESVIENVHLQLQAEHLVLCDGEQSLFTMGLSQSKSLACHAHTASKVLLFADIPGYANYYLVARLLPTHVYGSIVLLALIAGIFVLMSVFMTRRWTHLLRDQIILPLKERLLGEGDLPILELHEIRDQIKDAEETRTKAAIAEAVIQKSHQVAHDIRSPLMVLGMFASTVGPKLNEEDRDLLRLAIGRTREIAETLAKAGYDKTLGMSSELSDKPKLLSDVLRPVLREKNSLIAASMPNIIITDETHLEHDVPLMIEAVELRRALANIINNAVEALPQAGGLVTLRTEKISADFINLSVHDNGKGIDEDFLEKIGQRGVTRGKASGLGLGVWHAKDLLTRSGGDLTIRSMVGKGSAITLCLPIAQVDL